jgi:hypothetical protein
MMAIEVVSLRLISLLDWGLGAPPAPGYRIASAGSSGKIFAA